MSRSYRHPSPDYKRYRSPITDSGWLTSEEKHVMKKVDLNSQEDIDSIADDIDTSRRRRGKIVNDW